MKLNVREDWLRAMAEKENGCFVSVGGLMKEFGVMPPEDNPADEVQDIDAMKKYYDALDVFDIDKLSPAPWIIDEHTDVRLETVLIPGKRRVAFDKPDGSFAALARNDLDVQMHRGWHVEKADDGQRWVVPQLRSWIVCKMHPVSTEAAYQYGHPVGLLTKADAWYKANIELK